MTSTTAALVRHAFVDGRPLASDERFEVLDPSTGAPCALVARCGMREIDAAVQSAREAFEDVWRHVSAADRAVLCRQMAQVLRDHRDELAHLESLDTGKPIGQAYTDADVAARYFAFYAGCIEAHFGQTLPSDGDLLAYTVPEPHGVCGHIIPWNYPLQVACRTVAPALAAGNTCVLKPGEDAPLTPILLGALAIEAGFPPGVLNVVPGFGEEAGSALAGHAGIDHIAFTGSREVGRLVMAAAAVNIVPITLELGGKSPQLVFGDCDLEAAVPNIVNSITEHAGQNCSAGSRVLVERGMYGRLVEALARAFGAIRIGPGSTDPDMGPLISKVQLDRVLGYIEQGKTVARLVTGGGVPADPELADGFFVEPTIFDEVPPGSSIAQEEIFGPVLSVMEFGDAAEAVALANGTSFGLAAGVWTNAVGLAHWLASELRVSQVFVNNYAAAGGVELPFGGCKKSGFGREKGFAALHEYSRTKAITVRTGAPQPTRPQ